MGNTDNYLFSIFPHGYVNREGKAVLATKPQQSQTIPWVHQYITSKWCASQATETLRQMAGNASKDEIADYKKLNFEIALFAGTFSYRNAHKLVMPTPFMVLDIDGLDSTEQAAEVRERLSHDPDIETELCFISPKGLGVKWVITLPPWTDGMAFKKKFEVMRDYTCFHHGIDPDTSGSDVSRACFLPYDPDCFINSKYLLK